MQGPKYCSAAVWPQGGELGLLHCFPDFQQQETRGSLDVSANSTRQDSDIIEHNPFNTLDWIQMKDIRMIINK